MTKCTEHKNLDKFADACRLMMHKPRTKWELSIALDDARDTRAGSYINALHRAGLLYVKEYVNGRAGRPAKRYAWQPSPFHFPDFKYVKKARVDNRKAVRRRRSVVINDDRSLVSFVPNLF